MAVNPNSEIFYKDLIESAENMLVEVCQNIGEYKNVPNQYIEGTIVTTKNVPRNQPIQHPSYYQYSVKSGDPVLGIVGKSKVISDFESFMESRGIMAKSNSPVTTKGLLNFYNNLAAFCSVKLLLVTGNTFETTLPAVVFYNPETVYYPSVQSIVDSETLETQDAITALKALTETMNSVSKGHVIQYNYVGKSSSSCSSSSSSSCSSSSNCSSIFIAYMKI